LFFTALICLVRWRDQRAPDVTVAIVRLADLLDGDAVGTGTVTGPARNRAGGANNQWHRTAGEWLGDALLGRQVPLRDLRFHAVKGWRD
jgi:hypothetical protein